MLLGLGAILKTTDANLQRSAYRVYIRSLWFTQRYRTDVHPENAEEGKTRGEVLLAASRVILYIKVTS